jgi:hypothetical protein
VVDREAVGDSQKGSRDIKFDVSVYRNNVAIKGKTKSILVPLAPFSCIFTCSRIISKIICNHDTFLLAAEPLDTINFTEIASINNINITIQENSRV